MDEDKIRRKINKKLESRDFDRMWGEDGPYSQVRLCEETRILDDSVSRVFLVVEAEINPFTFEYIQEHRQRFINDEAIIQLLDHAEDRGDLGYVVSAGEVELSDEESKKFARRQTDMTIQTLIRMHKFVMDKLGIERNKIFGVIEDKISGAEQFVWNDEIGRVETVDDGLWDDKTFINSPSGILNNKMRFFVVLAFGKNAEQKKKSAIIFAKTLKAISLRLSVEIENVESFQKHILITSLIPLDIAPAIFIETVLSECNMATEKPLLQKDYFVTNVKKPTPDQVFSFLKQLPLDRNIRIKI